MIKRITFLLACCWLCGVCYAASDSTVQVQPTAPVPVVPAPAGPAAPAVQAPPVLPKVESIEVFHSGFSDTSNALTIGKDIKRVVYPGNTISFHISHPEIFLKSKPSDQAKVVLYINGIEMPGITADWYSDVTTLQIQNNSMPQLKDPATINIPLFRNPASQKSWDFLYRNTKNFTDSYFDVRAASVGWEHMAPLDKGLKDTSLTIAFYKWWEFGLWSLLYILILVAFAVLAWRTNVLRASSTGPYSLSNAQLLFWTSLVMGAFIYTLLLTDVSMSFNTSILYMMGISLGTTGAATVIDQNKINNNTATVKKQQGFIKDLLTDGDSYSVQRVQTFAWNVILGVYFIIYTVNNKTMPEFSTTMLLLAGFSSTSYLAGKVSENMAPAKQ